jgi:hypothetical protein
MRSAVQSLTSGQSITVSGGLGNDVLTVGTGDIDTTVLGNITFNGEGRHRRQDHHR